ncbi:MAG: hypothetical protein ACUVS4_06340 [Chloroflexaceae bacterium]
MDQAGGAGKIYARITPISTGHMHLVARVPPPGGRDAAHFRPGTFVVDADRTLHLPSGVASTKGYRKGDSDRVCFHIAGRQRPLSRNCAG